MNECYVTARREWVRFSGGTAAVGLTSEAISGDIVFVQLPKAGTHVQRDAPCASVEAVKTVVEVCAPQSGTVCAINESVLDDPDMITEKPMQAWLFRITLDGPPQLDGLTPYQQ